MTISTIAFAVFPSAYSPASVPVPVQRTQKWTACAAENQAVRMRARVAYDGRNYHGFQFQVNAKSVQGTIEEALERRFQRLIRVVGASRTDTGVHARGQAVHFDVPEHAAEDTARLQHAMNMLLPRDIRIRSVEKAPPNWHAIFSATSKHYSYRISSRQVPDPLWNAHRAYVYTPNFDPVKLCRATEAFRGYHDFAAFANASPAKLGDTRRNIISANLVAEESGHWRIDFILDGALYKMVRNVVGTIVAAANGAIDVNDIDELFRVKDRQKVPKVAPACGLTLEHVFYEGWDHHTHTNLSQHNSVITSEHTPIK